MRAVLKLHQTGTGTTPEPIPAPQPVPKPIPYSASLDQRFLREVWGEPRRLYRNGRFAQTEAGATKTYPWNPALDTLLRLDSPGQDGTGIPQTRRLGIARHLPGRPRLNDPLQQRLDPAPLRRPRLAVGRVSYESRVEREEHDVFTPHLNSDS